MRYVMDHLKHYEIAVLAIEPSEKGREHIAKLVDRFSFGDLSVIVQDETKFRDALRKRTYHILLGNLPTGVSPGPQQTHIQIPNNWDDWKQYEALLKAFGATIQTRFPHAYN